MIGRNAKKSKDMLCYKFIYLFSFLNWDCAFWINENVKELAQMLNYIHSADSRQITLK